jgi:hypothetical protein
MNVVRQVEHIIEMYNTVKNTYETFQHLYRAEKRALENLKSVVDIRSFSDFMNWQNRQMYLERRAEDIYKGMNVKVGKNSYSLTEIDQIPDALRNTFSDPFNKDFTEEEKRDIYLKMGLTPGNYIYLKTWQQRNDAIAKKIRTYGEIFEEETEEAFLSNQNLIDKYKTSSEDIDINEITKEAHITAMKQEMLLRELIQIMIGMHDYDLSRDKMMKTPPSPPKLPYDVGDRIFGSITEGVGSNNYSGF